MESYKDWFIFPNRVFSNYKLLNCSASITGNCITASNIYQCIDKSSKYKECVYGMYDYDQSICLPIYHIHKNTNLSSDLIYTWDIPELRYRHIYTYVRKSFFPDLFVNAVHYDDLCQLHNVETNTNLYTSEQEVFKDSLTVDRVDFVKQDYSMLRIMSENSLLRSINRFTVMKYGDPFFLNLSGTNFILRQGGSDSMKWILRGDLLLKEYDQLKIIPLEKNKKKGDLITYGDRFYIMFGNISILSVTDKGYLIHQEDNYDSLIRDGYNPTFQFVSEMNGYYCDGTTCKSVPVKNLRSNDVTAMYNGNPVFVTPNCDNLCVSENKWIKRVVVVIIAIGVLWIIKSIILIRKK